jgi:lysophospholipase L1-like esterase
MIHTDGVRRRAASWLLLLAGTTIINGGALCAADLESEAWIGTWRAAPQAFIPAALLTFRNQTVRLIAHSSIGGRSLRLHLSNAYGKKPLTLGPVRIAVRARGANIRADTQRIVRFQGMDVVTIAAGATLISDPVSLEIPRSTDLAVSLYFPGEAAAATNHWLAMQSSYVSSEKGDRTGVSRLKVGKTIHSWPFLTGIDVDAADALGALVVLGDSTVDGDGSTPDANHRWPDEIARVLNSAASGPDIAVLNAGIIGNRLLRGSPHDPPSQFGDALGDAGVARWERDVFSSSATKWVIVRIGINDIGLPGSIAPAGEAIKAADLIEGYKTLIERAHRHQVKIYVSTLGPFEGADVGPGYYSPEKEAVRQEVNAWIRTGAGFDGVIDVDAILKDPQHPSRMLRQFDSGDHLHANDAGNAACAEPVTRQLLFNARRP